jgi:gamma-glutamylcyclotransferase (GGCT)/AIG2-like uncharacterized protein YtfP
MQSRISYVNDVVIPSYELCEAGGWKAVCKSRFAEVSGGLYRLDEAVLSQLDEALAPELVRHQAMAADEERLYNVYLYVTEAEQTGEPDS